MNKKLVALLVLAGFCLLPASKSAAQAASTQQPAAGAQTGVDQDIKLLREDIRAKKKALIAANLTLTPDQATKFWPVYDQYTVELVSINNEKYAVIKQYADQWGSMTDDQALALTNRALAVDQKVAALRVKYVPIFNKVVPGKVVASFFQIDRRVQAAIDIQIASQIPLVQAQD